MIQNTVVDIALDATSDLPAMQELDTLPTTAELSKAIASLASRKALAAGVLRSGKSALLETLHELLYLCWDMFIKI